MLGAPKGGNCQRQRLALASLINGVAELFELNLKRLESPKRALCAASIGSFAFHFGDLSRLSGNKFRSVLENALGQLQALFSRDPIYFSDQKTL